ncbi:hypothetical protein [Streptomyces sp. NPDC045251]|uniref:hypothetical protein n=1 Tax=unclassified Streptomyces TaxID=2593676 RepID=UPI0033FE90B7
MSESAVVLRAAADARRRLAPDERRPPYGEQGVRTASTASVRRARRPYGERSFRTASYVEYSFCKASTGSPGEPPDRSRGARPDAGYGSCVSDSSMRRVSCP